MKTFTTRLKLVEGFSDVNPKYLKSEAEPGLTSLLQRTDNACDHVRKMNGYELAKLQCTT
jgi:hypothetical protein